MAETKATSLRLHSLAMSLAGDEFHLESEEDLLFSPTRSIPLLAPYPIPRSDARRRRWRSKGALPARPRPPFVASVCADQISYHPPILRARVFILRDRLLALGVSATDRARWLRRQPPIDLCRKQSIPPGRNVVDRLTLISRARTKRTDPASRRRRSRVKRDRARLRRTRSVMLFLRRSRAYFLRDVASPDREAGSTVKRQMARISAGRDSVLFVVRPLRCANPRCSNADGNY